CFFAGANSIFYGDRLLTTSNPEASADMQLFARLGIHPEPFHASADAPLPRQDSSAFYDAAALS
ncbi:MAG: biotin synthase BioB, partial [Pseudohongiellaceae bacterium]